MTRTELIINTRSRRGRVAYPKVIAELEAQGISPGRIYKIRKNTRLSRLLENVKARRPTLVIVGGGDGTISDVVDHLVGSGVEIGIIPLGTTNNFARSLHIPLDIAGAVDVICHSPARLIDLGLIGHEYFTNVAGIGISAQVADRVTNTAKRRWGRLAYAITGLQTLLMHKPFQAVVEDKDSELKIHLETHALIIANGRYHAGTLIAADTAVDNGELVLFSLGGSSRLSFLWQTLRFYTGHRQAVARASYIIGKNIIIHTHTPQPVELDGEVKFHTPISAKIEPASIHVRSPL